MNYAAVEHAIHLGDAPWVVPAICRRALSEIAGGRRELRAARHPLGFLCLPVYRDGERGVCVHVWSAAVPPAQTTTSPVHSHSWDLMSFVLYGRVRNTLLDVADDPVAATHRIFEIHSRGDVDEIRSTARCVRSLTARQYAAGPGGTYQVPIGRFHASAVDRGSEAATVVLGHSRPTATDLSLGPLDAPSHRVRRQRCGTRETAEAAKMVLHRLAAGEPDGVS